MTVNTDAVPDEAIVEQAAAGEPAVEPAETTKPKRRKVGRGQPLTERVRGSIDTFMSRLHQAFRKLYPSNNPEWLYPIEVFGDFIIVTSDLLESFEYYLVTYEVDDQGNFTFANRGDWEIVELTYQPISRTEARDRMANIEAALAAPEPVQEQAAEPPPTTHQFSEVILGTVSPLQEARQDKRRRFRAQLAQADTVNLNNRRYPATVMREAVSEARERLLQSGKNGRAAILGEDGHPSDKPTRYPKLTETVLVWENLEFNESDGWIYGDARIIPNSIGKDVIATMEEGVLPGVSLRAYGEARIVKENGREIEEVVSLRFEGFDLVMTPGFEDAAVTMFESLNRKEESKSMSKKQEADAQVDEPEVEAATEDVPVTESAPAAPVAAPATAAAAPVPAAPVVPPLTAELAREMGMAENATATEVMAEMAKRERRRKELEERELKEAIATAIHDFVEKLAYPANYRAQAEKAITDREPKTLEEATKIAKEVKELFDPLVAEYRLRNMGYGSGTVQSAIPVIEAELGIPEYMVPAMEITETMRKAGFWRDRSKVYADGPMARSLSFAEQYKKAHTQRYQQNFIEELGKWREALTTTQLNLPYSVIAAVVDEAFPQLVAPAIFDVGVATSQDTRVYYELSFEGESGYQVTVTDEEVTSDDDTWVDLAHGQIVHGTVVVTSDPAGTTYTEGTDYVIDYHQGKIMTLDAGSISDNTGILVDYQYRAVRLGEGVGIVRARSQTAFELLSMKANRLATQVTDEAIRFARSELGFDAVARTLNLLVKEMMRGVDEALLHTALSHILSVPSNSGGTWTSASDPVDELLDYIGNARVKVANRYYAPNAIVCSLTNAELISRSDHFTAAGSRPDFSLNPNGFAGTVKGLPLFFSTEFTDAYIMVADRQLVSYRTLGAMELKGPYPTYSNGLLTAAEEYFLQEYDGHICPIPQKGAYVKVS